MLYKRFGFIVLICLLPFVIANTGAIQTSHAQEHIGLDSVLLSITVNDNTAYLCTTDGLSTYDIDNGLQTMYTFPKVGQSDFDRILPSKSNGMFALDSYGGKLYYLKKASSGYTSSYYGTIDMPEGEVIDAVVSDHLVYILISPTDDDDGLNELYRLSLPDCQLVCLLRTETRLICSYRPGKLLIIQNTRDVQNDAVMYIAALDTETGDCENIVPTPALTTHGLAYDFMTDTIYILGNNQLFSSSSGSDFVLCGLPAMSFNSKFQFDFLGDSACIVGTDSHRISIVTASSMAQITPLIISGGVYSPYHLNFLLAYPQISVNLIAPFNPQNYPIGEYIRTGQDYIDIFCVKVILGEFESLRDKGFLYPLSESAILTETVNDMYPQFASALKHEGAPVALPVALYGCSGMGVNAELMDSLDFIPTTYSQFFEFISPWIHENQYADTGYALFSNTENIRMRMFSLIYGSYLSYNEAKGEMPIFTDSVFLNLLAKLDEVFPPTNDYAVSLGEQSESDSLFDYDVSFLPYSKSDYKPLILKLDEGMDVYTPIYMDLYCINPNATNKENAIVYLEYLAQNMGYGANATLFPKHAKAVEEPSLLSEIEKIDRNLEEYEQSLLTADEDDARTINDLIYAIQETRKHLENNRWLIKQEHIDRYKVLVPKLYIPIDYIYSRLTLFDAQSLINQYLSGKISAEMLAKKLDVICRTMYME